MDVGFIWDKTPLFLASKNFFMVKIKEIINTVCHLEVVSFRSQIRLQ